MNVIEKYKNVSFANGKFLSDKSYAYDSIYFVCKFIYDFVENEIIDFRKYKPFLEDYLSRIFNIKKLSNINNYCNESIHVLIYARVIKKMGNNAFKIIDMEALEYIVRKIENAYIFNYTLSYYTVKNSNALDLYKEFCKVENTELKIRILKRINEILYELNPSTKKGPDSQWARQNTEYIMNNLNFINGQPKITKSLTIDKGTIRNPRMISTNVAGTKTIGNKNNAYLYKFDFEYVETTLKDILIRGDE